MVAAQEDKRILGIPLVVRIAVRRVEPPTIVIVFDIEDVQVAIGVP